MSNNMIIKKYVADRFPLRETFDNEICAIAEMKRFQKWRKAQKWFNRSSIRIEEVAIYVTRVRKGLL